MNSSHYTDVIIIGAGLSGLCLAHELANKGVSCRLIDKKAQYPESFRADKLEHNQIALFRALGVDAFIFPQPHHPIGTIQSYKDGTLEDIDTIEQYGFDYTKTVNNLRTHLPESVPLTVGSISSVNTTDSRQTIELKNGEVYTSQIVVIATGGNESVTKLTGIQRSLDSSLTSLNFGFDVTRKNNEPFKFSGFNYYAEDTTTGIDYVTFFLIGDTMRVNIFTQWDAKDPRAKAMRKDPLAEMPKHFHTLYKFVGDDLSLHSKVQMFPTHFYRSKGHKQKGVVVIADEFQSVSPATGKGLDKLTNDVTLLSSIYIPKWLASGQCTKADITDFYSDSKKVSMDLKAISDWMYYRKLSTGKKPSVFQRILFRFKAHFNQF